MKISLVANVRKLIIVFAVIFIISVIGLSLDLFYVLDKIFEGAYIEFMICCNILMFISFIGFVGILPSNIRYHHCKKNGKSGYGIVKNIRFAVENDFSKINYIEFEFDNNSLDKCKVREVLSKEEIQYFLKEGKDHLIGKRVPLKIYKNVAIYDCLPRTEEE